MQEQGLYLLQRRRSGLAEQAPQTGQRWVWRCPAKIQMLRQDFFLVADQQGEVDDVFQLADVAWLGIALEDPLGFHADGRHRQVQALGIDADEVFRQRQDVSRTFAQWRQAQAAVVQVLLQAG